MQMTPHEVYVAGAIIFFSASCIFFVVSKILLRPYHSLNYLMLLIPLIVTVAYLCMSAGIGMVSTGKGVVNVTRYIDWIITTPIMLYILSYTLYQGRNASQKSFFLTIAGLDILMLLFGIGAEFTSGNLHTLLFSAGSLVFLMLLYLVIDSMLKLNTREPNPKLKATSLGMAWTILALWSLYPFVWIFSPQGLAVFDNTGVAVAFLALDFASKLIFNGLLVYYFYVVMKNNQTQL